MKMYNTLMAVSAGGGLLLLVMLGRELLAARRVVAEGWAAAFFTLGAIMTFLGGVMTVTWPLPRLADNCCRQDNIIFGEPTLAFGVMLLAGGWLLMRVRGVRDETTGIVRMTDVVTWPRLATAMQPLAWFAAVMGLGLAGIAVAGVKYKLYAAPPQEPISGRFADHPLIEALFISSIFAFVAIGAILFPFGLRAAARSWASLGSTADTHEPHAAGPLLSITAVCWVIAGIMLVGFGALNYFTHIGLIMNLKNNI